MDDFLALIIAAALDAEVGIDEEQRFDGQVFQLQVPYRMIRRDVADSRQAQAAAAHARIIIM